MDSVSKILKVIHWPASMLTAWGRIFKVGEKLPRARIAPLDSSLVEFMVASLGRGEVPSHDEQLSLAVRGINGDLEARNEMLRLNYRLALHWANRFTGRGLELADLFQESLLGLIHAIEKFRPDLGYKFSTYASIWIRNYLQRAIYEQGRIIRVPTGAAVDLTSLERAITEFEVEQGREPSLPELSALTGFPQKKCETLLSIPSQPLRISTSPSEDSMPSAIESIPQTGMSMEDVVMEKEQSRELLEAVEKLSIELREIVEMYFGLSPAGPFSVLQISNQLGRSQRDIARKIEIAIDILRIDLVDIMGD